MVVELIHKLLNFTAPAFTIFCLFFLYPPLSFFKFLRSIFSTFFSENVAGKVVLITGASSGIGESLAYEYASRGACLSIVARRDEKLRDVAEEALFLGSPDVHIINADVSKVEDCQRIVHQTIHHFGRLDHLVNNAGISSVSMFEDITDITAFRALMDTNFWGSVYMTHFAVPHLRDTAGKIVVLSSSASWLPMPRMSIYNASKAAMLAMFETLRVELGPDISVTVATPGFIESELTQGKFLNREGRMTVDPDMRDVQISVMPIRSVQSCTKAIVRGVLRGQRYVTDPPWFKDTYVWKLLFPEVLEWGYRLFYLTRPGAPATEAASKRIIDLPGAKNILYPSALQSADQDIQTADQDKTD